MISIIMLLPSLEALCVIFAVIVQQADHIERGSGGNVREGIGIVGCEDILSLNQMNQ
ncbi:hypothetical protein [Lacticaseibacillus nasuensis]|uniref:hypothetical protein n=1 Tax=Lacticaseibacillus nasuensis TaxID=944671 RepID=UPI001F3193CA|nr:hypothetical protein [Lacticaseibacillus nasuensis]